MFIKIEKPPRGKTAYNYPDASILLMEGEASYQMYDSDGGRYEQIPYQRPTHGWTGDVKIGRKILDHLMSKEGMEYGETKRFSADFDAVLVAAKAGNIGHALHEKTN